MFSLLLTTTLQHFFQLFFLLFTVCKCSFSLTSLNSRAKHCVPLKFKSFSKVTAVLAQTVFILIFFHPYYNGFFNVIWQKLINVPIIDWKKEKPIYYHNKCGITKWDNVYKKWSWQKLKLLKGSLQSFF